MSLLQTWWPHFHGDARSRGRTLFEDGAVELVEVNGQSLSAKVKDGRDTHAISLDQSGAASTLSCTCRQGRRGAYCEHMWAALAAASRPSEASLESSPPSPPRARKRRGSQSTRRSSAAEPRWVGRLSLLHPGQASADRTTALTRPKQICYVLRAETSAQCGGLALELQQRQATVRGWSSPKPFRLTADAVREIADPTDRELCGMILGGRRPDEDSSGKADDRGQSLFRLAPGSWRSLLRRMCRTRRCFLDRVSETETLLTWDATTELRPWTLWMSGRDSGEDLTVGLELRQPAPPIETDERDKPSEASGSNRRSRPSEAERETDSSPRADAEASDASRPRTSDAGDDADADLKREASRRLRVDEPDILLGGADGVIVCDGWVGCFDDREATRWVNQFRDEARRRGRPHPIRVPYKDIPAFLDRLYTLPHLPEIDLPEGVGRAERQVRPTPHLELFSPHRGGADRETLTGRALFAYGEQRVKPDQAGRFITTDPPEEDAEPGELEGSNLPPGRGAGEAGGPGDGEAVADRPHVEALEEDAHSDTPSRSVGEVETDPARAGRTSAEKRTDAEDQSQTEESQSTDAAPIDVDADAASSRTPGAAVSASESTSPANTKTGRLIRRDLRFEDQALASLISLGFRTAGEGETALLLPAARMGSATDELLRQGWRVFADDKPVRASAAPRLTIASGVDWFELHGQVEFQMTDGRTQRVSLPEILAAARAGRAMIDLDDGARGLLPQQWLDEHALLTALGETRDDHLRFRANQAQWLDALISEDELEQVDERFEVWRERLATFTKVEPIPPAPSFQGELRPYQQEGLGWLRFLNEFGMGGILADDMGLGKTVQVLALLDRVYGVGLEAAPLGPVESGAAVESPGSEATGAANPSLIVVPRSVLFNWAEEAERFAPQLKVLGYAGPDRGALLNELPDAHVVLTSYGLLRRDIDDLQKQPFEYVVLDEAQAIKNPKSQAAQAARLLQASRRLALTGTPVENHLGDLWSIFEFLNPGMLGNGSTFAEMVKSGAQEISSSEAATQAARALRPFIFRRTKQQVLRDLPDKTEQTLYCEMEPPQREVYQELLNHYRHSLLSTGDDPRAGSEAALGGGQSMMVLEALLRLRQAACHPGLLDSARAGEPSAKLEVLLDQLSELIDEGHKALVFSQFTSMLSIVRNRLDELGIVYEYLDGQTRHRKRCVDRFQNDDAVAAFLISLKAGGLGLNLTAADYVFILDPWWNPAVEQQAIDRAHRIGQTRHVFAYRLICQDTVEQRIAELQKKKRDLADAIVGGQENLIRTLTRDDLELLLS